MLILHNFFWKYQVGLKLTPPPIPRKNYPQKAQPY